MSAHVLLNLLNELGKMRDLWSILSLSRNESNKFQLRVYKSTNVRFYLSYGIDYFEISFLP